MTESLFFLLLVATFYYLASRRWLAACVGASLLTVTRVNGAAAACAVGVAWLHDGISVARTSTMWRELLLITLIPLPMCLFMGFMYGRFGDAFAAFNAHRYFWANQPVWPFHNLLYVFYGPDLRGRLQSGVSLIAAAAFILQWRSFTIEEIVLVVLTLLMTTSTYVGGLLSTPRYLLPLYPIHMAVGSLTDRYQWAAVLIPSLCLINGLLMVFW